MMYFTRSPKSRPIYRSLFTLSLVGSVVFFSLGVVESPKATGRIIEKPKLQEWHINGISAALEEDSSWIGNTLFPLVFYDGRDLKHSKQLDAIAQKLAIVLRDKKQDSSYRGAAAQSLINLGDAGQPFRLEIDTMLKDKTISLYEIPKPEVPVGSGVTPKPSIPDIANTLKNKTNNLCVRTQAAKQLINLGDSAKAFIPDILEFIQEPDSGPYHGGQVYDGIACDGNRGNVAVDLPKFGASLNPFLSDLRKILNNKTQSSRMRGMAASALASLGDPAKVTVPDMVTIIRDKTQDFNLRSRVSRALSSFGGGANPFIQDILNVLKDRPKKFADTEADRLEMVFSFDIGVSQLEFQQALPFLDMAEFVETKSGTQWRYNAYVESGGNDEIKTLLKWVGKPKIANIPTQLNYEDAVKTLTLFAKTWEFSSNSPHLRRSLMPKIAIVTQMTQWQPRDKPLLTRHYNNLITLDPTNAKVIKGAIDRLDRLP